MENNSIKSFAKPQSAAELKKAAEQIMESDPDIDKRKLDNAASQFHKEKKEDSQKQAENDAEYEQPKQ